MYILTRSEYFKYHFHFFQDLVDSCPNLRDLDVSDSSLLTPASLNTMVEGLTYLESVSTSRCYNITPSSYLMLTAWSVPGP